MNCEIKKVEKKSYQSSAGEVQIPDNSKWVLLYFYPKDDTPGCTIQAKDFTALKSEFDKLDILIYGCSRDSLKSHDKFIDKFAINYPLISDEDESLCKAFNVIGPKKFMGREYIGITRSTFIIAPSGEIIEHYHNVKAPNHAEQVLEEIKKLKSLN